MERARPAILSCKHINHVCIMWHVIKVNSMKTSTQMSTISVSELPDITPVKSLIFGL